jgi:phosphoglycolate phosphatase
MSSRLDFSHISGYVFDFDGTLCATPLNFDIMHQKAMEAMLPYASIPQPFAGPVLEDIDRVCAALPPDLAAKARQAAMKAIEAMEVETARQCRLFPYTRPLLSILKALGVPAAVITRNCAAAVYTAFPDLAEHVACVLTRDDVSKPKPDPEHLLLALSRMGLAPDHALMVGDHPLDLQTGKRAGTLTAGVASGNSSLRRLAAEAPDYLADDLGQLMRRAGILPD